MKERLLRTLDEYKRLFFLALAGIVLGAVVGVAEVIFGGILDLIVHVHRQYSPWSLILLPFCGLLVVWLGKVILTPECKGMKSVFSAVFGIEKRVPLRIAGMGMLGTWLSHLGGASVGKEGVGVQIGAALADFMHKHLPEKVQERQDHSLWIIAGMAAGFSGLFQVPFCAIVFALEVIASGTIQLPALIITVAASLSAKMTASALGWKLEIVRAAFHPEALDISLVWWIVFGIAFGLAAMMFTGMLHLYKDRIKGWIHNPYQRIFVGGIIMALLLFVFGNGRYGNSGMDLVNGALSDLPVEPWDWFGKLMATVLCLGIGFMGGEVTPLFTIGATLGAALASFCGLDPAMGAAIGLCAVFGSGTGILLAPIILGMELFGSQILSGLFISCAIAFAINRSTGIYAMQRKICLIHGTPTVVHGRHSHDSLEFF